MNMYWGQGCSVARSLGSSTGLLHYCTFGLEAANDAQNVMVDTACGKDNDQQNLSNWQYDIAVYIIELLQMSENTNNPVYKLTKLN